MVSSSSCTRCAAAAPETIRQNTQSFVTTSSWPLASSPLQSARDIVARDQACALAPSLDPAAGRAHLTDPVL